MKIVLKLLTLLALLVAFAYMSYEKARPKVYDCVLFFNEPELLEIRLHELYDHVDKFVVVESIEGFQGKLKPLYYEENKFLFKKFEDKIIHVPLRTRYSTSDPWERKTYQRNQIMQGLTQCRPHDIVLFSDMDEVIRASKIPEIKNALMKGGVDIVGTNLKKYAYFLNRFERMAPGTVATTYGYLKNETTPQHLRHKKSRAHLIDDAGWHFVHLGGLQRVLSKIEASTYANKISNEQKDPDFLQQEMQKGVFEEIDETFPKFIRDNEKHFRKIGFIH